MKRYLVIGVLALAVTAGVACAYSNAGSCGACRFDGHLKQCRNNMAVQVHS